MKSLLATLALTTALTVPGLAMARPVTLTTSLNSYGGGGAYLAFFCHRCIGGLCRQSLDGWRKVEIL